MEAASSTGCQTDPTEARRLIEPRTQYSTSHVGLTQALQLSDIDTASWILNEYNNQAAATDRFTGFELTMPDAIEAELGRTTSVAASHAWGQQANGSFKIKRETRGWTDTNQKRLAFAVRYTLVPDATLEKETEGETSHHQTAEYPYVTLQRKDGKWVCQQIPGRCVGDYGSSVT